MVERIIRSHPDSPAFTDYEGETYTFREVGKAIFEMHYIFRELGIRKGDKVALIGRNMSNWAITYLSTVTYGAVVVPILPDFQPNDIHHIINHSESVFLFASNSLFDRIDETKIPDVKGILSINDFQPLADHTGKRGKALV